MIQCLRLLLEEMTEDLDPSLDNTAAKLRELKPDEEASQAKLWEYRVNIQALWEDPAIQVSRSLLLAQGLQIFLPLHMSLQPPLITNINLE